jgi:hypothetical protein
VRALSLSSIFLSSKDPAMDVYNELDPRSNP